MGQLKQSVSKKSKNAIRFILIYCTVITALVVAVLLFAYQPDRNSLGALGSLVLDVFSMAMLMILVISVAFEKDKIGRTTWLFLALMLCTIWALFFDFLNWAFDGSLEFADWTYVFTVCSLVCGSILGAMFCLYLSSYLDDMYNLNKVHISARICVVCNAVSFLITVVLALTKTAFDFVDGHYKTGALYDVITVIPIMTLLYMMVYVIRYSEVVGFHDVCAVVGYIVTMILGALIEAAYGIGTTYVSVSVANLFIFIMLQNKLIDRVKKQREVLAERITSQFAILESMAGIYSHMNYVDLEAMTSKRFDQKDSSEEPFDLVEAPHTGLNRMLYKGIEKEMKANFWNFTDLSTLPIRMAGEKAITAEFRHREDGWFRAQYIRIGDSVEKPLTKVIYTIRNIDEEKKNVEKWIKKSNTDELTGFYNRHAYEDEIASMEEGRIKDNLVYVSIDVNGLKIANDTKGHGAGDELLIGACDCMKQCFGSYGKLFRTGGDEFVALIFADEAQLDEIKKDIEEVTENWHGKLIDHLAISCGYVTKKEAGDMSLPQMAVLADKRMYDAKNRYYQTCGIDRRGQRDAHVALCALYTKILKINLTDDTYQIVNMNSEEQTDEMGFSARISNWLSGFGTSGQVHPDDLAVYLEKTDLEYMRTYFKENKTSLCILYRRKYPDGFKQVLMEIIPAGDYSDDMQNLYLYVKNIEQ